MALSGGCGGGSVYHNDTDWLLPRTLQLFTVKIEIS